MQRTGTSDKAMVATKFAPLPWRFTSQSVVDACKVSIASSLASLSLLGLSYSQPAVMSYIEQSCSIGVRYYMWMLSVVFSDADATALDTIASLASCFFKGSWLMCSVLLCNPVGSSICLVAQHFSCVASSSVHCKPTPDQQQVAFVV